MTTATTDERLRALEVTVSHIDGQMGHVAMKEDVERLYTLIETVRGELRAEIETVRGELRTEIETVRGELRTEIQTVRGELRTEIQTLRGEDRAERYRMETRMIKWVVGAILANAAITGSLVYGLTRFFG